MIESESQIRVRYVETDAGGIVHHSNFVPWLEVARVEMMDNLGLPYRELEKLNVHMAVLEVHLQIIKPAYFDDILLVKTYVHECPKAKMTVDYKVSRNTDLIATATTTHAFINPKKKATKPPLIFNQLMKNHF